MSAKAKRTSYLAQYRPERAADTYDSDDEGPSIRELRQRRARSRASSIPPPTASLNPSRRVTAPARPTPSGVRSQYTAPTKVDDDYDDEEDENYEEEKQQTPCSPAFHDGPRTLYTFEDCRCTEVVGRYLDKTGRARRLQRRGCCNNCARARRSRMPKEPLVDPIQRDFNGKLQYVRLSKRR